MIAITYGYDVFLAQIVNANDNTFVEELALAA